MIETREVNQNARKLEVVESFIVHITQVKFCEFCNLDLIVDYIISSAIVVH